MTSLDGEEVSVECDCIKPCMRTIFEPIVSNAALSRLSLDSIQLSSTDEMRDNRMRAMDVQIRADDNIFMELLETLYDVREMYEDFIDTTLKKTENLQENLIDPTVSAIKGIIDIFQKDFNQRLFEGLDEVMDDLDTVFGPSRDTIYFLIERVIRNAKIITLHARNLVVDRYLYEELEELVATTVDYAEVAVFTLPRYYDMVTNVSLTLSQLGFEPSDFSFLPVILAKSSEFCEHELFLFNNMTHEMYNNLNHLQVILSTSNFSISDDLKKTRLVLKDLMVNLQVYDTEYQDLKDACLEMYYLTVQSIRTFNTTYRSQVEDHINLEYSFDYMEESVEVREDEEKFIEYSDGYLMTGKVSKTELQERLSEELLNDFVSRQRALITKVKFRLTERLRRRVDIARADIIDWYQTLISNAKTMQDYMAVDFMESRSKQMQIWLHPVAVMAEQANTTTVVLMEKEESLNITYWSQDELLGEEAQRVLEEIINAFFDPINAAIDLYDDELDGMEQDMTSSLKRARNLMTEYRAADEMDDSFVL